MRCPNCDGHTLMIEVVFRGNVTALFHTPQQFELTQPVSIESSWTDDSPCICENCRWAGRVADAIVAFAQRQNPDSRDE